MLLPQVCKSEKQLAEKLLKLLNNWNGEVILLTHEVGKPAGVAIRARLHGQGVEDCHVSLPACSCSWAVTPVSQPGGNRQPFVVVAPAPALLLFLIYQKHTRENDLCWWCWIC